MKRDQGPLRCKPEWLNKKIRRFSEPALFSHRAPGLVCKALAYVASPFGHPFYT